MAKSRKKRADAPRGSATKPEAGPRCGLCGKTGPLRKTECCGNWVCDDAASYVLFSYATNSCSRNHQRYTLCGFHYTERHPGSWKGCPKCRAQFADEDYEEFGTSEYNFEKLEER